MQRYYADLHIHVGMTNDGRWVKIPTSPTLTIDNIISEAINRKGIDIIGIVDALSPFVLSDIKLMIESGLMKLYSGGGYRYLDKITVILGAEIETIEQNGKASHTLIYLPDLETMRKFSECMSKHIKNINLSSQNAHMPLGKLIQIASNFGATIVPAHIFTPHKSLFGVCCSNLEQILSDKEIAMITAIELGLSADSNMADRIKQLNYFTFLSNSDAHSLGKIAREYNVLSLSSADYEECVKALKSQGGRNVAANYGLDPRLGKYHNTLCLLCGRTNEIYNNVCNICGSTKIINGVADRIKEIASYSTPRHPSKRPPYYYQIPLEFIPGLGKKTMQKLLNKFGTEMNILHNVSKSELTEAVGNNLAERIYSARAGESVIFTGGGGKYGKIGN